MKKTSGLLFIIFSWISFSSAQDLSRELDGYLQAAATAGFNGSVLVARHGHILVDKGYGFRNSEQKIKHDSNSVFQIGSVTKQFTAVAILRLREMGKLSLSDKLSRYYPEFPGADSITLEQLLTHTSGIHNYTNDRDFMEKRSHLPTNEKEMMALFSSFKPDFSPGSQFSYSNSGYSILGYIIQRVAKKPYEEVIREFIFRPLGMNHSGFDFANLHSQEKSTGYYALYEGKVLPAKIVDSSVSFSAGAIYSCSGDLYRWNWSLINGNLLTRSSLSDAFTPRKSKYGFGLVIDTVYGKRVIMHDGGIDGFLTHNLIIPDDSTIITVFSNAESYQPGKIGRDILSILSGKPYKIPELKKAIRVDSSVLQKYTGVYEFAPDFSITVTLEKGQLQATANDQPKIELYASSQTLFFTRVVDAELEFVIDASGNVEKAILHQGGQDMPGKKVK